MRDNAESTFTLKVAGGYDEGCAKVVKAYKKIWAEFKAAAYVIALSYAKLKSSTVRYYCRLARSKEISLINLTGWFNARCAVMDEMDHDHDHGHNRLNMYFVFFFVIF